MVAAFDSEAFFSERCGQMGSPGDTVAALKARGFSTMSAWVFSSWYTPVGCERGAFPGGGR
eukprot:1682209-Lingulodinium_polyedra.AAC.1